MGDGLELSLRSIGVLPFNTPFEGDLPWGLRGHVGARLNVGFFFTEARLEGGAARFMASPMGVNLFDSTPAPVLSDQAAGNWVYRPTDSNDTWRGNFGIRGLNFGFRFAEDFQIRLGRHRYDTTEYETWFMANGYSIAPRWANLNIPYGWLGGEFRYDRRRPNETVRRALLSVSLMDGAPSGYLAMTQGLIRLGLSETDDSSALSFTAYAALRGNPPPTSGTVADPGTAHGEGLGIQVDHGIFTGGLGYHHQVGAWESENRLEALHNRLGLSTFLDFHPGPFRFRGALSWLTRQDNPGDNPYDTPSAEQEVHTEITASYRLVEGLQTSLGYQGVYGAGGSGHTVFLGLQTNLQGAIPF